MGHRQSPVCGSVNDSTGSFLLALKVLKDKNRPRYNLILTKVLLDINHSSKLAGVAVKNVFKNRSALLNFPFPLNVISLDLDFIA